MDKSIFRQIGFIDTEIEIYLALLQLGPSLVSDLHKEKGIDRTHIYGVLEKLREKGLVSTFIQSGKKHFQAAPPEKILAYVEEKKEKIAGIVPELNKIITAPKDKTSIELFKGKEGIKTVLQDVLKEKKDYCVMGSIKKFEKIIEFAFPHFLKKVEKLNINERIICDTAESILKIKTGKYRVLKSSYLFPSSFWVYGSKVIIFIWDLPYFAIVISNQDVANTYQNYFDFFWELAAP